ncbi:MAG TPA: PP2C family protein-serine/threonine phosphatase [Thermoanaerobaculia bacterium]|nr:PP2C family protein-serine/threonine phosphatase [Thermoanaerobaculia bacterium]
MFRVGIIGVAVFLTGLAAAVLRLPEWRNRSVPDEAFFATRLHEVANQAGLALESEPRARLRSKSWLHDEEVLGVHESAYDSLGPDAADWLAREGRGPYVETIARSRWSEGRKSAGELRVLFSLRGVPVSAMWMADDPFRSSARGKIENDGLRRRALLRVFAPGGVAETEVTVLGETVHLAPVPNADPAESLLGTAITGPDMPYIQRIVGAPHFWRERFESLTLGSLLITRAPPALVRGILYFATLILFILLLARHRIELNKGLVLGAMSIALSIAGPIRNSTTWLQLFDTLADVIAKGLALFVLWSTAESWLRSTIPGFRTSLDLLRAGRLGPKGGKALLAGSGIGAAAAGLSLIALSLGTLVPGVAPANASVGMPLFGAPASPIDEGAIRTAYVMLAICAGLRWPLVRRFRGSATVLAGIILATRIPLSSFWVSLGAGLLLAIVLVRAYKAFGLTALLAASMMSAVLPAALFSTLHITWMPFSALLLIAVAIAPVAFGAIGVRRPAEVEEGALRMPTFVRRLEEENRVKYEMDLLARMQLGLLPQEMPRIEGYEIAAHSILATEVGGDLYDFLRDVHGRIWIAAGDVSGHGYSCAIAQAMVKAGLASLIEAERTPSMVLERLDHVLRGIGTSRTFTSMALLRLDPITGEALLSNAGHPFPFLATDGGAIRELELPSLPLGQGPPREYANVTFTLDPGAALLMFSDGLFEGTDATGRAYGFDRIRDLLAKAARRPAADILAALLEDWRAHVGTGTPEDDTTVVVVKRRL